MAPGLAIQPIAPSSGESISHTCELVRKRRSRHKQGKLRGATPVGAFIEPGRPASAQSPDDATAQRAAFHEDSALLAKKTWRQKPAPRANLRH
jgi:hypothetical protein